MGSAPTDTFAHGQGGVIPLPSRKGTGVVEAPDWGTATLRWTLCSSNEQKQCPWQTRHCLQRRELPQRCIRPSAFASVSHSHFCYVHAQQIHLPACVREDSSQRQSFRAGGGGGAGSIRALLQE